MPEPLRPSTIDIETGCAIITLNPRDVLRAYPTGFGRYMSHRQVGNADGRYRSPWDGPAYLPDVEGILSEIAFWLICGLEPPDDLVLPIPVWERARGPNGGEILDVLGIEVRGSTWPNGRIIVHRDGERDGPCKDDVPFVLAALTKSPVYPKDGFTTGVPEMDSVLGPRPNDLNRYDVTVRFTGWAYGRDATEWFDRMRHPEWTVPKEKVRRMDDAPANVRAWPDLWATLLASVG